MHCPHSTVVCQMQCAGPSMGFGKQVPSDIRLFWALWRAEVKNRFTGGGSRPCQHDRRWGLRRRAGNRWSAAGEASTARRPSPGCSLSSGGLSSPDGHKPSASSIMVGTGSEIAHQAGLRGRQTASLFVVCPWCTMQAARWIQSRAWKCCRLVYIAWCYHFPTPIRWQCSPGCVGSRASAVALSLQPAPAQGKHLGRIRALQSPKSIVVEKLPERPTGVCSQTGTWSHRGPRRPISVIAMQQQ